MGDQDYLKFYDLERYLFEEVSPKFIKNGNIDASDFFCIVIWKSNRTKTRIISRLLKKGHSNLNDAVNELTTQIFQAPDLKSKMSVLIEGWGFRLPMSSAILTVLYPDVFTIYDIRVCEQLNKHFAKEPKDFYKIQDLVNFNDLWDGYCGFLEKVQEFAPKEFSLRDKDRWIWGKSFMEGVDNLSKTYTLSVKTE